MDIKKKAFTDFNSRARKQQNAKFVLLLFQSDVADVLGVEKQSQGSQADRLGAG